MQHPDLSPETRYFTSYCIISTKSCHCVHPAETIVATLLPCFCIVALQQVAAEREAYLGQLVLL